MTNKKSIKPGDIYWAKKFGNSEFKKTRPLVIYHEKGSRVKIIPMSSKVDKIYPLDLYVGKVIPNYKESKIMCGQVKSISKKSLLRKASELLPEYFDKVKMLVKELGR